MENRITTKIKTVYYLELLTCETMKLLGSTKRKISKDKNGENAPHLEITEVVLYPAVVYTFQCCQQWSSKKSIFLFIFLPNKSFGQLLDVSPKILKKGSI